MGEILRPSQGNRFITGGCTGYLSIKEWIKQDLTAANIGTAIHKESELYFKGELSLEEVSDKARAYVTYLDSFHKIYKGYMRIEQRVEITDLCYGTADAVLFSIKKNYLHVFDLKTGQAKVDPKCPQLKIYALGAWLRYRDKMPFLTHVEVTIFQYDKPYTHTWSIHDLEDLNTHIKQLTLEVQSKLYRFNATDIGCQYCPHIYTCAAAIEKFNHDVETLNDETLDLDERIESAMSVKSVAEKFLTAVKAMMTSGNFNSEGFDLKFRRGAYAWTNEEAVLSLLKEKYDLNEKDVFNHSMLSPAKLKKLVDLEAADIQGYLKRKEGTYYLNKK